MGPFVSPSDSPAPASAWVFSTLEFTFLLAGSACPLWQNRHGGAGSCSGLTHHTHCRVVEDRGGAACGAWVAVALPGLAGMLLMLSVCAIECQILG